MLSGRLSLPRRLRVQRQRQPCRDCSLLLRGSETFRVRSSLVESLTLPKNSVSLDGCCLRADALASLPIGNAEPQSNQVFHNSSRIFHEDLVSNDASPRTGSSLNPQPSPRGQERQVGDATITANRVHFDATARRRASAAEQGRRPGLPGCDGCGHSAGAGKPLGVLKPEAGRWRHSRAYRLHGFARTVPSAENWIETIHFLPRAFSSPAPATGKRCPN